MAPRWNRMVFDEDDLGDVVSISVIGSDEPLCACGDLSCVGCSAEPGTGSGHGLPTGGLAQRLSTMADPSVKDEEDIVRDVDDGLADRLRSLVHDEPEPAPMPIPPDPPAPADRPTAPHEPVGIAEPEVEDAVDETEVEEIVMIPKPAPEATPTWTYQPRTANDAAAVQLHARLVHARRRLRSLRPGEDASGGDGPGVQEIPKARRGSAPPANVASL